MSTFVCEKCSHATSIFGDDGARNFAKEFNIEVLGDIPLDKKLRESCDNGIPIVLAHRDNKCSSAFRDIAEKLIKKTPAPLTE